MKTSPFLSRPIGSYLSFTLAIILALVLPISLLANKPQKITRQPAADLKQFEGTYQLLGDQNLKLQISAVGSGLTLKELWSNREISFQQKADLNFVAAEHPEFTLDFVQDKSGTINQVTAFKRDIWIKANANATEKKLSAAETARLNQSYQKIFPAFQEAINANATDKIQSFLKTYLDESLISALTLEKLTVQAKEMYQKTGGIMLDTTKPINPETGAANFKSKNQAVSFQMSFTLNPAGKITNFGLQE
ncbi:hypothetical protein [Adhaeribacter rhizoryzae]|uniref:DUF3471 domain-containing protein n=1 Tax=Adhaeribacter rhizoryzae TaxID=2607907 RepID=A0A5M6DCG2_9BACT|nr:hypothetical protein [Adhaeribacter rhizoryzae]KAA5542845.1 hypothetical protein F0145_18060 [Adhaeribacter rhizoryzae]